MPDRIKEETDDFIVLHNAMTFLRMLLIEIVAGVFAYTIHSNPALAGWDFFAILFFLSVSVIFFIEFVRVFLIKEKVTIDKKLQSVIINSFFGISKLPFSDIEEIKIKKDSDPESSDSWSVNLVTVQGDSTKIYDGSNESDAERVAKKISKITGKKISHEVVERDYPVVG